ncbi:unnamed protein product [Allacma fusca]|uniref:Uncharacterized protein n=1 Tax=Allacma fusca TaxID=39272 RepID=A0A8J2KRZ3_9HEXA|nr:unnamed protein product [Allacma fusca]
MTPCLLKAILIFHISRVTGTDLQYPQVAFAEGGLFERILPELVPSIRNFVEEFLARGKGLNESCNPNEHIFMRAEREDLVQLINGMYDPSEGNIATASDRIERCVNLTHVLRNYCAFNPFWSVNETDLYCDEGALCRNESLRPEVLPTSETPACIERCCIVRRIEEGKSAGKRTSSSVNIICVSFIFTIVLRI